MGLAQVHFKGGGTPSLSVPSAVTVGPLGSPSTRTPREVLAASRVGTALPRATRWG